MCFSSGASFTSSIVLTGFGVASLSRVHKPSQIVFAAIPLLFATQQFIEGVIWLTTAHPHHAAMQRAFAYLYLLMAEVLWPLVVPLSMYMMEEDTKRKRILLSMLIAGAIVALHYTYALLYGHFFLTAAHYHIQYQDYATDPINIPISSLYCLTASIPLFVSSIKGTSLVGTLLILSLSVSVIFFHQYVTSVWCFFAAAISFVVFFILKKQDYRVSFK
jgi:hypothetical protein